MAKWTHRDTDILEQSREAVRGLRCRAPTPGSPRGPTATTLKQHGNSEGTQTRGTCLPRGPTATGNMGKNRAVKGPPAGPRPHGMGRPVDKAPGPGQAGVSHSPPHPLQARAMACDTKSSPICCRGDPPGDTGRDIQAASDYSSPLCHVQSQARGRTHSQGVGLSARPPVGVSQSATCRGTEGDAKGRGVAPPCHLL